MGHNLSELDVNIITLKWMVEDYGHLVDVAIEHLLETIETIRDTQPELALKLSQVFVGEDVWENRKKYAVESYLEELNA